DKIAILDEDVPSDWNGVFLRCRAIEAGDVEDDVPALWLGIFFDDAINFRDDRCIARCASLEQLSHTRQTTGDVARSTPKIARHLDQPRPNANHLAIFDEDLRAHWDVVA